MSVQGSSQGDKSATTSLTVESRRSELVEILAGAVFAELRRRIPPAACLPVPTPSDRRTAP